jgi:hypothetical protein
MSVLGESVIVYGMFAMGVAVLAVIFFS